MRGGGKRNDRKVGDQGDLFDIADMFPVLAPAEIDQPLDLSLRIKTAMGRALKECPDSADIVAAKITKITGRELTEDALYSYTAASKPDHDMGIARFVAFVRATGATWLLGVLGKEFGLTVLEGREAHLARLGLIEQELDRLQTARRDLTKELRTEPVRVTPRNGRRS